jgi:hypothetical protein
MIYISSQGICGEDESGCFEGRKLELSEYLMLPLLEIGNNSHNKIGIFTYISFLAKVFKINGKIVLVA